MTSYKYQWVDTASGFRTHIAVNGRVTSHGQLKTLCGCIVAYTKRKEPASVCSRCVDHLPNWKELRTEFR